MEKPASHNIFEGRRAVEAARIMRDVHNGPLEVNRGPDAAPAADRGERFAQDRAEIVTTAILQIVCNTLIEGSTATAPLWRAVIGGLIFATVATLMFVPVVFSMVHKKQGGKAAASSETSHAH